MSTDMAHNVGFYLHEVADAVEEVYRYDYDNRSEGRGHFTMFKLRIMAPHNVLVPTSTEKRTWPTSLRICATIIRWKGWIWPIFPLLHWLKNAKKSMTVFDGNKYVPIIIPKEGEQTYIMNNVILFSRHSLMSWKQSAQCAPRYKLFIFRPLWVIPLVLLPLLDTSQ